jgi:diadenosine tetraphosphatase ApaH/serine/threonine PP2A family protein phosphatase
VARIAVVSDIHGNRHAFEAVLAEIDGSDYEAIWCLGDLVGYGAEPDACVDLAARRCAMILAGNHDLGVLGSLDLSEFSPVAKRAAEWTRDTISPATRAVLSELSPSGERDGLGLYHASPRDPVWEYVLSALVADLCFDEQRERVCLIGHSHVALAFWRTDHELANGTACGAGDELTISAGQWLINPGSVGQPRDGDPRAAWLELDLEGGAVTFHRTDYDIDAAAEAIRSAGLPGSLADRLFAGQ